MTKEIPLTKGRVALVDDDDYDALMQFKWQVSNSGYAIRRPRVSEALKSASMHRQVMGYPAGADVHHKNRNTLDNRKDNLEIVTRSQNLSRRGKFKNNASGFKGVVKLKNGKWRMTFFAQFDTPEEAGAAYDRVARLIWGDHAMTNEEQADQ